MTDTRSIGGGGSTINSGITATYHDDCFAVVTSLTQSGIEVGDVRPGVSVLLTLVFKEKSRRGRRASLVGERPVTRPAAVLWCRAGLLRGVVRMNAPFVWLLLVLVPTLALAQGETQIAAVVNDAIITDSDLGARLTIVESSANLPDTPENRKRLQPQVLRSLIDEKLQMQEAKRLGISVSKDDVAQGMAELEQRNHMPKGGLDQYLKARGISRSSLVDQLTASIAYSRIVQNHVLAGRPGLGRRNRRNDEADRG